MFSPIVFDFGELYSIFIASIVGVHNNVSLDNAVVLPATPEGAKLASEKISFKKMTATERNTKPHSDKRRV